tara:strand:+ start:1983 stop:2192 length:210 start_codon:yes stop_codon:yes gene_type:complete
VLRRSKSIRILSLGCVLAPVILAGCASGDAPAENAGAEPVRETQNPDAPPFGNPRPKIRPKDVVTPEDE